VIGDVQGCWRSLRRLLDRIGFDDDPSVRVHLLGDLVNRGTGSLNALRWAYRHRDRVELILGNHELGMLAASLGVRKIKPRDTITEVLQAPDRDALLAWVRSRPFVHIEGGFAMIHAGLMPGWTVARAASRGEAVSAVLRSDGAAALLKSWRGCKAQRAAGWGERDVPAGRQDSAAGRIFALNALTRMRCLRADGSLDLDYAAGLQAMPEGLEPWFDAAPLPATHHILAGHWAALGVRRGEGWTALDAGCVWGNALAAMCLDSGEIVQVAAQRQDLVARPGDPVRATKET